MVQRSNLPAPLLEIATGYIGIVVEVIVDVTLAASDDVGRVIDCIGNAIPDMNRSRAFHRAASGHFTVWYSDTVSASIATQVAPHPAKTPAVLCVTTARVRGQFYPIY